MELFAKIVRGGKLLNILAKTFNLDVLRLLQHPRWSGL